jgi:hypothetical protein
MFASRRIVRRSLRRAHLPLPDDNLAHLESDLGIVDRRGNHSCRHPSLAFDIFPFPERQLVQVQQLNGNCASHSRMGGVRTLYPANQSARTSASAGQCVQNARGSRAGLRDSRSSGRGDASESFGCLGLGLGNLLLCGASGLGGRRGIADARAADGEGRVPQQGA